jgi:hypothetical protein
VLWNYDRRVVAVLALFILGTTGELISWSRESIVPNCVFPVAAGSDLGFCLPTVFNSLNAPPQSGSGMSISSPRAMIMVGPTLATNVLSTLLIGIQVWWVSISTL